MPKKVLILNTSAASFAGGETGVWLEECAAPYYIFVEAGLEVSMATPAGGPTPIDKGSMGEGFFTDACKKFLHDQEAMSLFMHTKKLSEVDLAAFDALYLSGGHGCCTDFAANADVKAAIETMYASKLVAADCHGPIALAQCAKPDGTPLVAGLEVTGFSDVEEGQVGQTGNVPFLIESKFKELGASYVCGEPWTSKTAAAGKLLTGQNPQSSEALAALVVKTLA
jgi:putative intracellular protease/amidase